MASGLPSGTNAKTAHNNEFVTNIFTLTSSVTWHSISSHREKPLYPVRFG